MRHSPESRYYKCVYPRISAFFCRHTAAHRLLRALCRILPLLCGAAYAGMLVFSLTCRSRAVFLKELLIPASLFISVTLLRRKLDFPRPYSVYPVRPLISKEKYGQSFPSRHAASAFIIAAAGFFLSVPLGAGLMAVAFLISLSRLLAGVHFLRDVLAGWGLGAVFGILFFI